MNPNRDERQSVIEEPGMEQRQQKVVSIDTAIARRAQRLPASVRAEWHPISASDQYVLQGGVAAGSATVTGIFDRLRPQARRDDGQPMMLQLDIPERYAVLAAPSPAPAKPLQRLFEGLEGFTAAAH